MLSTLLIVAWVSLGLSSAYAEITESFWEVEAGGLSKKLPEGKSRHYEIPAKLVGKFTIEGELPDGSALEIDCGKYTSFPTKTYGEIIGGNPGTGKLGIQLEQCTLEKPEKEHCELSSPTLQLLMPKMEIVENEANHKILLAYTNAEGPIGILRVQGLGCAHRACPNMEGIVLAEVSPENSVNELATVTFSSALTKYINIFHDHLIATFDIGVKAAKLNGAFEMKLETAGEDFGPFVK